MENLYVSKNLFFYSAFLFLLVSLAFHAFAKEKKAILFLIVSAFLFFLFAALVVPFLNVWDERFHALVGKNLMKHLLMPTLYNDPAVTTSYVGWDKSTIWVHKQPLFLWQMAFSYKLWGVNELGLRFPSIILSTLLVFAGYRSGKLLLNERAGYYVGFLITTSSYLLGLIGGWHELDQNDLSFLVYISLSLWAWIEYLHSNNKWWFLAIGVFSGFAILCKWLVGLLVYGCWGIYTFFQEPDRWSFRKYKDIALAFLITIAVALPWQILIFKWYPAEAREQYSHNVQHFLIPLDGHDGPYTYHLSLMGQLFGSFVPYLLIPAIIIFFRKNKNLCISFTIITILVYVFFSMAQTKMPSFTTVLILIVYLFIASFMDTVITWIEKLKFLKSYARYIVLAGLIALACSRMDFSLLKKDVLPPDGNSVCFDAMVHNKEVFKRIHLSDSAVIFNVPGRHYIEAMFYTGLTAYNFIPNYSQYMEMKNKNRPIALFKTANDTIPPYLLSYPKLIVIKDSLSSFGCE